MRIILKTIAFLSLIPAILSAYILFIYFSADINSLKKTNPKSSWVELKRVSNHSKWAIIVSEDWAFYDHQGVDLNQLKIVIEESIKFKKLSRGASTISQQVIKNLFLTPEKSLTRKFKELILTYKLEQTLSKDRILEIYFNIIEFGENLYGIKDASFFYFNKAPSKLNAREGAFLAMLLPNPKKYSISFRNRELTNYARETILSILIKLRQAKVITEFQREQVLEEAFSWEMDNYHFD